MKSHLKSGTALLVSFSLIGPMPVFAQSADTAFPCVAPSGEEVADADQFAQSLLALGSTSLDGGTCSQDALDEALASGGDALNAALAPAVEEAAPVEEAPVAEEAAEEPALVEEVAAEPAIEEPVAETEPMAETEPAAEAEPAAEVEAVEEEPSVEEPMAEEPVAEAEPVAEVEAAAEAEPEAEAELAVEEPAAEVEPVAETESSAEEQVADDVTAETEPAAEAEPEAETEPKAEVEAETEPMAEAEPKAEAEAETEPMAEAEPTLETTEPAAGEAGGEVVTDEMRQEMAAANATAQAETSAAASAEAEVEADAAEVTSETITEDDVRTSDQDFDTSVNANAETTSDNKGLSNFEKALLLGLGAVVVGSVLKNGDEVVSNSGDRVVIERDGELRVLKNDDQLLQRPGAQVQTQTFNDGSTRSVVTYEDASQIITIKSRDGTVLRRTLIRASDGSEVVLFDDTRETEAVDFAELPTLQSLEEQQNAQDATLVAELERALFADVGRRFSLQQVRDYKRVRAIAPQVEVEAVTFASGSAAIDPSQAEALGDLGLMMRDIIENNPSTVFLIEGHTDAVGAASYNLALSDRRAETVALALTEYYAVPPQNLITQGYGESDLKVRVLSDERANRRAVVRNITQLLN